MAQTQTTVNFDYMTPSQKVAALMIALGPETAAEIMKNITDEALLEQITLDIASLNKIPAYILNSILEEFHTIFLASDYLQSGGMNYAQTLLEKAYGSDKAENILERLSAIMNTTPFQYLNDAQPAKLANAFKDENPQLIALILAYLRPEHSAKILGFLPLELQAKVALKIADMGTTNPEILAEVEKVVESKFSSLVDNETTKTGGVASLANILNRADRATERNIIELLETQNHTLAEEVRELMFVFEDIVKIDDRDVQRILREVETRDLAMALKGTKDDVKEKVLSNMSERAQNMLIEDMEYMGPVRAKNVQEVQAKIVAIIRMLEAAGEIVIIREEQEDEFLE